MGIGYTATRGEDRRIAHAIHTALGDAHTILNVGAGTGSYEPRDREVLAVEPSAVMIAQRQAEAAPAVRAHAEALPFADASFDAAMALLSDHHWDDWHRGLCELRRVARRRVVLFNADPAQADRFWLTSEFLPGVCELIPTPYRLPGSDGFYGAFWRRPAAYLDPRVRAGISVFARLDAGELEQGLACLSEDLRSGAWQARHGDLLQLNELDLGYRIVVAEIGLDPRDEQP